MSLPVTSQDLRLNHSGIDRKQLGLDIENFLGPLNHGLRCADFGLSDEVNAGKDACAFGEMTKAASDSRSSCLRLTSAAYCSGSPLAFTWSAQVFISVTVKSR